MSKRQSQPPGKQRIRKPAPPKRPLTLNDMALGEVKRLVAVSVTGETEIHSETLALMRFMRANRKTVLHWRCEHGAYAGRNDKYHSIMLYTEGKGEQE